MRCPACQKEFYPQPDHLRTYWANNDADSRAAERFSIQQCPSCFEIVILKAVGNAYDLQGKLVMDEVTSESAVYPVQEDFVIAPEVPAEYSADLIEAHAAIAYSAKASAALSRRLLQKTLREVLGIKKRDLSLEIDEFIESANAPTYLTGAVDAVRHVGNFAAHPVKYVSSGEIVDVEAGEAEWLLEVLESLFDFVFVQPAKLEQRRSSLNEKLRELGKPELKQP
jgi:hypothetical protein